MFFQFSARSFLNRFIAHSFVSLRILPLYFWLPAYWFIPRTPSISIALLSGFAFWINICSFQYESRLTSRDWFNWSDSALMQSASTFFSWARCTILAQLVTKRNWLYRKSAVSSKESVGWTTAIDLYSQTSGTVDAVNINEINIILKGKNDKQPSDIFQFLPVAKRDAA